MPYPSSNILRYGFNGNFVGTEFELRTSLVVDYALANYAVLTI